MEIIKELEIELKQIQNTCKRLNVQLANIKSQPNSHIVGELKHRCVALKNTLTRVQKISTWKITN